MAYSHTSIRNIAQVHPETTREKDNMGYEQDSRVFRLFQKCAVETTMHGIRYLFERDVSIIRRLLWLVIVLACAAFCAFQFYTRGTKYMDNSELVNLDLIVVNQLDFPRVVICNKNVFKMTMLKESRPFLLQLFDIENAVPDEAQQKAYLDQINTKLTNLTEEYITRGHRIQDMLVKCTFAGVKCTADNFTMVITEYGICYQFNGGKDQLTVINPGVGSGLSLILDAEHYDYSNSFQDSAGIYMSIQAPNEALLLRETSIAIPTGAQTMVGLELTDVIANPDGDCSKKNLKYYDVYSVTACRLECLTAYVVQNCGCKGIYMPGNFTECSFNMQFTCVRFFAKNFTQSEAATSCSCPVACTKHVYNPTLSHGPISDSRARSLALGVRNKNKQSVGRDYNAIYDFIAKSAGDQQQLYSFSEAMQDVEQAASAFCGIVDQFRIQLENIKINSSLYAELVFTLKETANISARFQSHLCESSIWESLAPSKLEDKFWLMGRDAFFELLRNDYDKMFRNMSAEIQSFTTLVEINVNSIIEYLRLVAKREEKTVDICSAVKTENNEGGTITFPPNGNYHSDSNCSWHIVTAQPDKMLEITIEWMDIESHITCDYDVLEIRLPDNTVLSTLCGISNEKASFVVHNSHAVLAFKSDMSVIGRGFNVTYTFKQVLSPVYMGCFSDQPYPNRDLPFTFDLGNENSIEKCSAKCQSLGLMYAGLQNTRFCFCGQHYGQYSNQIPLDESECSLTCSGNAAQICGGSLSNSVYRIDVPVGIYLGCFLDMDAPARDLPFGFYLGSANTIEMCVATCSSMKYSYAGVQATSWCYCGNHYGIHDDQVARGDAECWQLCLGNYYEICGSDLRNSIYLIADCAELMTGQDANATVVTETILRGVDNCEEPCPEESQQLRLGGRGVTFSSMPNETGTESISIMINNNGFIHIETVVVYAATREMITVTAVDINRIAITSATGYTNEPIMLTSVLSEKKLWSLTIYFARELNASFPIKDVTVSIYACLSFPEVSNASSNATNALQQTRLLGTPTQDGSCNVTRIETDVGGMIIFPTFKGITYTYTCVWKIATDKPFMHIELLVRYNDLYEGYAIVYILQPDNTLVKILTGNNEHPDFVVLPYGHIKVQFYTYLPLNYLDGGTFGVNITYSFKLVLPGTYLGCFSDKPMPERDLTYEIDLGESNSAESCIMHCNSKNYLYAGLQSGSWCYCGNNYGKLDKQVPRNDEECRIPCSDSSNSEYCGGLWRNAIYRIYDPNRLIITDKALRGVMETFGLIQGYETWFATTIDSIIENQLGYLKIYVPQSNARRSTENVIDSIYVGKNLVIVDVFYNELRYQSLQKQWSDSTVSLICDLGGTFGLWLGASMMSVYEIVDFFLCLMHLKCM